MQSQVARAAISRAVASRRRFRRLSLIAAAVLALGLLLSACGSSDNSGSSTTASSGRAPDISKILKYIGPVDAKNAGKGKQLDVGVTVALSGIGSVWGNPQLKGAKLAAKQIAQLGGPKFNIISNDNRSGSPAAGTRAARELGLAHVGMGLTSYIADLGAMLPDMEKYRMLSFDGGGGTSLFAQGKPYFYGTRAITPNDAIGGIIKYIKATSPDTRRVAVIFWDLGGDLNKTVEDDARKQLEAAGMELVKYEATQIGATDFTTVIQHLSDADPDAIFAGIYGIEVANFMKQYVAAGEEAQVYGFDLTSQAVDAAGSALSGFKYAFDYLDIDHPPNNWAKVFVDSYRAEYGEDPDFYSANFYEDMFILWDLVRRVNAKGGDPSSGADLQAALQANPRFKSVYGGSGDTPGTIGFDLRTHSVAQRPMGLFEFDPASRQASLLARFDINGADFEQLK